MTARRFWVGGAVVLAVVAVLFAYKALLLTT